MSNRSWGTSVACLSVVLGLPAVAAAALPSIVVRAATATLSNGAHTGVTITASCASGRLVSGGGIVRLIDPVNGGSSPGPGLPRVPTNGLVLGGTVPSTGTSPVDTQVADLTPDPSSWMAIANFTGVAEAGDQGSSFAMCATGGPSHVVVKAASTIGANATQQVSPPILTTATCPGGDQLVGGGAMTTTPDTVNNGTTAGNNGNVKPMASYPSDATGAMLADGSTAATSWTAFGSAGITAATDQVIAFAVCSTAASAPPVQVARADTIGPLGQPGTTVLSAPVTCPTGTRLLGGGYRVDETVAGTAGLQPQQGEHMRGSYPAAANGAYPDGSLVEALDGTPNPTTWTSVGQLGGQNLPANSQLIQHGFALCAQSVSAPAVTTGASSGVTGTSAGLAGTVTPNGLATTFVFEFGPSLAFGSITPPTSAGAGQAPVGLTASLGGLQPGTTYFYRVVATNAQGTAFGPTMGFTTTGAQAPDAVTLPASGIGNTGATLAGQVNPRGQTTAFAFEYGTSTGFGAVTPTVVLDGAGSPEPVSAAVSGLSPSTTYFYRVVAVNPSGTTRGAVMAFTTGPTGVPVATTGGASGLSPAGATLGGTVDARGEATAFAFEYGTTTSFGSLSAVDTASPTGGPQAVSLSIGGLAPNTTYLYRLVATNADGTATGTVHMFTTPSGGT